jgi:hydrogenase 3 maturation protease
MSTLSWEGLLNQALSSLQRPDRPTRIAIVGIGQELRGDDAAGVAVARALSRQRALGCPSTVSDRFLIIDAGAAPENQTGPLRRFAPDLVLLIDAAQMDEAPGAVRWLDWQDTSGLSASTHTLPPYVLASYLSSEIGCRVALIGIQPADTSIGAPLSPDVQTAVDEIITRMRQSNLWVPESSAANSNAD